MMFCIWWKFESVIHWDFAPNGRAIDADIYSQQLERVHKILRWRYSALVNRNRVLLQQDDARTIMTKIQEFEGIELLPHPAYSLDLAPSDYHLFRSMVHFLAWKKFGKL